MRVFGCLTNILTPKEKRLECGINFKACVGLFLGYEKVSKTYRAYDSEVGQVVISCDVNVDESIFRLSLKKLSMIWSLNHSISSM